MKSGTIIAFPERQLRGANLASIKTTRLKVNGAVCLGISTANLDEVCEMLGVKPAHVAKTRTDYEGVYLAQVNRNGKTGTITASKKNAPTAAMKKKYMELCGYNRKATQVKTLRSEVSKLEHVIEQCQQTLVASLRKLEEKRRRFQIVQGTDESSLVRFGDEFDQLVKHPDLERVDVVGNKIVAETKPISISYQKVTYDIGRFQITIHADGSNGGVRMVNLTRKIGGRNHPHINSGGVPCLGNIKEVIPHMIAEHQYPAVVAVCIQYLKSYENSGNYKPYCEIGYWPQKRKKGVSR